VNNPTGRPAFVNFKYIEAQIIADAMESGFDAAKALILVNKYCKEIGEDSYTITPVQTCYCNLKPRFNRFPGKDYKTYMCTPQYRVKYQ
jgi:hypothetical protein